MSYYNNEIIYCPRCGTEMDICHDSMMDVECPNCGMEAELIWDTVDEQHIISSATLQAYNLYDDLYDEDDVDDMPACCRACGGPYPSCMTSCKMFDD